MNKILYPISIFLLFFNALTAVYGGIYLILDPSGESLQLSIELLSNTPFQTYLLPGLTLLVVNGFFNLYTVFLGIFKKDHFPILTIACGVLLIVWLGVQILLIQEFFAIIHITYFIIGALLVYCGQSLIKDW